MGCCLSTPRVSNNVADTLLPHVQDCEPETLPGNKEEYTAKLQRRKLSITTRKNHVDTAILQGCLKLCKLRDECVSLDIIADDTSLSRYIGGAKPATDCPSLHSISIAGDVKFGTLEAVLSIISEEYAEAESFIPFDKKAMMILSLVRHYFWDYTSLSAPFGFHRATVAAVEAVNADLSDQAPHPINESLAYRDVFLGAAYPYLKVLGAANILPSMDKLPDLQGYAAAVRQLEVMQCCSGPNEKTIEATFLMKREECQALACVALIRLQHDSILEHLKLLVKDLKLQIDQQIEAKKAFLNMQDEYKMLAEIILEHSQMEDVRLFPEIERCKEGTADTLHSGSNLELPIINGIQQDIKVALGIFHDGPGLNRFVASLENKAQRLLDLLDFHFKSEERAIKPIMKRLVQRNNHGNWPMGIVSAMQLTHTKNASYLLASLSSSDIAKYCAAVEVALATDIEAAYPNIMGAYLSSQKN